MQEPAELLRNISALVQLDSDDPPAQEQNYELPRMIEDLRKYQVELEIQNKALRFSQSAAEGAS